MTVDGKAGEAIAMEPISTPISDAENASIIKQTRTRRLFSGAQLYAFAISCGGTWHAAGGNLFFPLMNGGPRGWLFGYILCAIGALAQAASLAEMASIQPIAGAQYYWTYTFGPRRLKLFLTWVQGWVTWLGYVAILASIANYNTLLLQGVVQLTTPAEDPWVAEGYHTTLIFLALLALAVIINLYFFVIVPWLELMAGLLNFLLFFATLVTLWVMAPRNGPRIFLEKSEGSGWGDFEAFHIGLLGATQMFILFESGVHMGEETKSPRKAVPKSMFWGWVTNSCMGLIMIFTWGTAMPADPSLITSSTVNPMAIILEHATGSRQIAAVIVGLITVVTFGSLLATFSSAARLTWAWGRDGGLPTYFAMVDGKTRVPMRACWLTAFVVAILALLNLNATAFIALGAITSLALLGGYCSYAIVIGCMIHARLRPGGVELGQWNLGRPWGMIVNVFAFVYTIWMIVWLPFPIALPVTAQNMNYSGPVFGFVIIAVISWWFVWAKSKWAGPNLRVVEIVLQEDDASSKR